MVRQPFRAVILEVPDEIAVPVEFLNAAAGRRALEARLAIDRLGGAKEMPVVEQVGCEAAAMGTRPRMDNAAIVVEKEVLPMAPIGLIRL